MRTSRTCVGEITGHPDPAMTFLGNFEAQLRFVGLMELDAHGHGQTDGLGLLLIGHENHTGISIACSDG